MNGSLEPFDFVLAETLHMTTEELRDRMSNQEYVQWAAFYTWRQKQRDMAARMANR
jgi:hypothetical protein